MAQQEQEARKEIDRLLEKAGWTVCDPSSANIHASIGVAIREFPLKQGHGFADYLLYVNGKAAGVIEAKAAGATLTGVEVQSDKYSKGLPDGLPAWARPLPLISGLSNREVSTCRRPPCFLKSIWQAAALDGCRKV
jgi:type I restriction enzyme R subunit